MYPFFRLALEAWLARKAGALDTWDTHVSHHRCWPWDIDFAMELNNGRTLTLLDLGRIPLALRTGLVKALMRRRFSMTMAGVSVRYRKRIRPFERFSTHSRAICFDEKFMYLEQAMIKTSGEVAHHALYRVAVTGPNGLIAPKEILKDMGHSAPSPVCPDWVEAWIKADQLRPWPPMQNSE